MDLGKYKISRNTRKKTNRNNKQISVYSERYLGEGSFGCVFKPEVRCRDKLQGTIINKNSNSSKLVSKIFVDKDDFNKEVDASKLLKKVDPSGKNILLPYKSCEVNISDIFKNKHVEQCEELQYYKNKTRQLYQLIMPYGGIRYDEYFKVYRPTLKEFFSISEPLFKALLLLETKSICHYDIRGANVLVGTDNKAIIIDHSLIIPYDKLYMPTNLRRLKKAYYPYPPECIVYYQVYKNHTINETNKTVSKTNSASPNFIYEQFDDSIHSYGEKRYNAYKSLINNTTIHKSLTHMHGVFKKYVNKDDLYAYLTTYANRVDIYSVGMLLVTVYAYIDYSAISKDQKDDFFNFIKKLIDPNVCHRLTPKDAYKLFSSLAKHIE